MKKLGEPLCKWGRAALFREVLYQQLCPGWGKGKVSLPTAGVVSTHKKDSRLAFCPHPLLMERPLHSTVHKHHTLPGSHVERTEMILYANRATKHMHTWNHECPTGSTAPYRITFCLLLTPFQECVTLRATILPGQGCQRVSSFNTDYKEEHTVKEDAGGMVILFFFWDKVSSGSGWPWIHSIGKDESELLIFLPLHPKC